MKREIGELERGIGDWILIAVSHFALCLALYFIVLYVGHATTSLFGAERAPILSLLVRPLWLLFCILVPFVCIGPLNGIGSGGEIAFYAEVALGAILWASLIFIVLRRRRRSRAPR